MAKSRRKIPKEKYPRKQGKRIYEDEINSSGDLISFSLKHFDNSNEKFSLSSKKAQYFVKVFERLKGISSMKYIELLQNRSSALKAHPIKWEDTSETDGFQHLHSQLQDITPYQFEISKNEHGRIHGFIIDSVFYIVWFDPEHRLYSKK